MTSIHIATKEMARLQKAHAWSPVHTIVKRKRNQYVCKYTFEDGSILGVYFNGDASWHAEGNGEQRWPNWHYCNR